MEVVASDRLPRVKHEHVLSSPEMRRLPGGRSGRAIRQEWGRRHRLPGGGRRPAHPRVRSGLGLEHRVGLARAVARALPAPPGVLLAFDHVRQARYRPVGPGRSRRPSDPGVADGRRSRGDGCRRSGACCALERLRGMSDVHPVRDDIPAANRCPGDARGIRQTLVGGGLSVRGNSRGLRGFPAEHPDWMGWCGRYRSQGAEHARRRALSDVVGDIPAHERDPRRRLRADPDERRHRRQACAADGPRSDADRPPHGRPSLCPSKVPATWWTAFGAPSSWSCQVSITFRGSATKTRSSTRSRSS